MNSRLSLFLHELLTHRTIRFVCLAVIVTIAALLVVSFVTVEHGRTVFGTDLGGDYATFYIPGRILNEGAADRLYDLEYQDRIYHELMPWRSAEAKLPCLYPPFVGLAFRPLARLPYAWSYAMWLAISLGLFLASLMLLGRLAPGLSQEARTTAWLLAVAFEPFLVETWVGGHVSAVGLFCMTLALYWQQQRRCFAAGLALGLCLYKPTLLLLWFPLLVIGRRWRVLRGLGVSVLALIAVSLFTVGPDGGWDYLRLLDRAAEVTVQGPLVWRTWKYVDLGSCMTLLFRGRSMVGQGMALLIAAAGLVWLGRAWWRTEPHGPGGALLWTATLTGTLVLNFYVGIWDTVLVLPGLWLLGELFLRREKGTTPRRLSRLPVFLFLVWVAPWITQLVAQITGLQLFSLVLAALLAFELRSVGGRASPRADLDIT